MTDIVDRGCNGTTAGDTTLPLQPLDTGCPRSRRDQLVRGLHLATYVTGVSSISGRLAKTSPATILMYHSVPEPHEQRWMDPVNCMLPGDFERQVAFLAGRRQVVSIDRLVDMIEGGEPIPRGTVAITFDDGYLNNLTVAAPILARYGVPATIYLATRAVDSGANQWVDRLYSTIRARTSSRLDLTSVDPDAGSKPLDGPDEAKAAYHELCELLIEIDSDRRDEVLDLVDEQLAPSALPPRMTMNWDEVRTLVRDHPNITIGAHTDNHVDLRRHHDRIDDESTTCISQIERETGVTPRHFAFPYNRHDADAETAISRYFRSSVGEDPLDPVVRSERSVHGLPRVAAPWSMTMLRSFTNGGYPGVSRRMFGKVWHKPD